MCKRNLKPFACRNERTSFSGVVFTPLMRLMSQLLFAGVNMSIGIPETLLIVIEGLRFRGSMRD